MPCHLLQSRQGLGHGAGPGEVGYCGHGGLLYGGVGGAFEVFVQGGGQADSIVGSGEDGPVLAGLG